MKYRKILIIMAVIAAVTCAAWIVTAVSSGVFSQDEADQPGLPSERTNTMTLTDERVFDYADKLTDKEENSIRELIASCEKKTACDIVLVVLDETLENYQPTGSGYVPMDDPEDWITAYADDFWDNNYFGYNTGTEGDGLVLVDNWYRESADGKMHTWISTSGRAYAALGSYDIDEILDDVYDYIDTDPCRAYSAYVKSFTEFMADSEDIRIVSPVTAGWYTAVLPLILALALLAHFWRGRKGRTEINDRTYVSSSPDSVKILRKSDMFLHKRVTRQRIPDDDSRSSGGFGGGHISSGGMSHGGGGHSR